MLIVRLSTIQWQYVRPATDCLRSRVRKRTLFSPRNEVSKFQVIALAIRGLVESQKFKLFVALWHIVGLSNTFLPSLHGTFEALKANKLLKTIPNRE